jgi:uncharacterized phage protein (TIGR02220 family)
MERGWIKLWRKLRDSKIFKHRGLLQVAIWALFKANYEENWVPVKTGKGETIVHLKPGQFIFGRHRAAGDLGIPPSTFRNWLQVLRGARFLDTQSKAHYTIGTIVNWETYQPGEIEEPEEKDNQRTTKGHREELKEEILSSSVIEYLNLKAHKNFKPSTKATQRLVQARSNEGYELGDFQRVIDVKCSQWLNDSKMIAYLRPQTLFGTKFESYLNEEPRDEGKYL